MTGSDRRRAEAQARDPAQYRIALLPGDGIGGEVIGQAAAVLAAAGRRFAVSFEFAEAAIGGAALEREGVPLPDSTLALCTASDAILLGAVGGPQWDVLSGERRPERGLLALRQALEVFANLRPARCLPALAALSPLHPQIAQQTDLLIVRELVGGLYFSQPRGRDADSAVDTLRYHREEIRRVVRVAFQEARARRGRLTSVDKANVLETSRLWREVVDGERKEFPDVAVEHMLVDTCAMQLVRNPAAFDVIVTENMFGDILSDEAGAIIGSLGMLPSASLGAHPPFLYEPVHGSAPDLAGKGVANPVGAILSAALLLRYSCALPQAATAVEEAVARVLAAGVRTPDLGGTATTVQVGTQIVEAILGVGGGE